MPHLRLLPFESARGSFQMALDETMLNRAANDGIASLRFYRWSEPTWSLGYFQSAAPSENDPVLAPLPWVRRASGGATILHHHPHELTYSFALPAADQHLPPGDNWICRMHRVFARWLQDRGVAARLVVCGEEQKLGERLCFLHHTPGDLRIGAAKVLGSARRKLHGGFLQHGTILLSQSEYTPQLPGISELSGQTISASELMHEILARLPVDLGWNFTEGAWTPQEREQAAEIERDKYAAHDWNHRR